MPVSPPEDARASLSSESNCFAWSYSHFEISLSSELSNRCIAIFQIGVLHSNFSN